MPGGRQRVYPGGQKAALRLVIALDVDKKAPVGKGLQYLVQRRHQANALAAERKGFPAVGSVAIADVQRLQFGEGVLARIAGAFCATIQRPVVEDDEMAIGGRVDVEFDEVRSGGEGCFEAGNGVFQIGMFGRENALGRAGVVL